MRNPPRTRAEADAMRYGRWAGNPEGMLLRPCYCAYVIGDTYLNQCSRKPGHGPDGLYCKQHARMVEEQEMSR